MRALSEPLRIALFSDSALPVLNGVSISVQSLMTSLRELGHSVHLYTARHFDHRDTDPNIFRFPSIGTPWAKGYPLAYPPFYPMLRYFRRHRYDVIHTHTPFTIGFVGLRWAQSHEIPIVSTYHTLYDRYAHYIPLPRVYVRYKIAKHTNYYYNRVQHAITPSEAAKRWLVRHDVRTPVTVIPTGVRPAPMLERSAVRVQLGVHPQKQVLLYVGRLAREKNLEVLLHMAAKLFSTHPAAELWLVGDGPYRDRVLAEIRDLGIGDRVRVWGPRPRAEVDSFYAAADLFVFPSYSETQGLVVQEAMTFGLPAVAISGGGAGAGILEGVNGFLVRNDADAFAEGVRTVLDNDALAARLGASARQTVQAFSTTAMTERIVAIYRRVAGLECSLEPETEQLGNRR